jgi:hypothetical protein
VPITTNAAQQIEALFDHLVDGGEKWWRNRDAERLRGFIE